MDFVFNCASCRGLLVARSDLRGRYVQCAHCSGGIEARTGKQVTEAVASAILDAPLPVGPTHHRVLRRVRPAVRCSSADASHAKPRLPSGARIARVVKAAA